MKCYARFPDSPSSLLTVGARWLALAGVILISSIGSAIAQSKSLISDVPLKIQIYPGSATAGHSVLWAAVEKGFCQAHGIKCELIPIASGPLGMSALVAGSIQVSYAGTDFAVQAAARGNDIQLIGGTYPTRFLTLSVRKDVPLPNLAAGYPAVMQDIRGLKVGVTGRGSATEIQARAMLIGAGMKPEDVTFVAVGAPATAYAAMVARQIDVALMWEPFATLCRVQSTCVTAVPPTGGPSSLRALNGAVLQLSATRKFIEQNSQVIDAFILAIQDSVKWVREPGNLEELIRMSKKYAKMDSTLISDEELKLLLQDEQKNVSAALDRKAVEAHAKFSFDNGVIDKPFNTENFVYKRAPTP